MQRLRADYSRLRFHNITSPQYRHVLLLLGWVGYFALYFLTENLIPGERCQSVHCALDDRIPFCEVFLIPYVLWYVLVAGSLGYFFFYDVPQFKNLQTYIIVTQVLAMAAYILFPTRQDLRPQVFPRDNFLTDCVALLYCLDTNTGVCPSLHVAYSIGIASVWLRDRQAGVWLKGGIVLFVIAVCLSTMFIKQHSALDTLAAIPVCLVAEWFVFYRKRL